MDDSTRQATRLWTLAMPTVSAFISSAVRDFRDRDDVLQEVAVAVIESFPSYDNSRPFVGWAIGIARNQIGTYLRKRRRNRLVFDAESLERIAVAFEEVAPERTQQLDRLHDCVKSLEGRARQMCVLRYEDDLKPAAIANLLDMSPNAVAKSLQRIRDQLRSCVEQKVAPEYRSS